MLSTYVTRAWADGVFDLREALVLLCKNWAAITDPNKPCPIEFSTEEMMEHERQLESFRCYEAAVDAVYSALHCEADGSRTIFCLYTYQATSQNNLMRGVVATALLFFSHLGFRGRYSDRSPATNESLPRMDPSLG
jgi:hypothetical protein